MKRIIVSIFFGIVLWTLGCTIDQGKGTFYVDAEITGIGHTILSVKYKIGNTLVFDDVVMKDNMGILAMIKEENPKVIPLKINIEFTTDSEGTEDGFLKYYYGANLLSESRSFDIDSLILVAKENKDMFSWTYRDSKAMSEDAKEESIESASTPTSPHPKTITVKPSEGEKL